MPPGKLLKGARGETFEVNGFLGLLGDEEDDDEDELPDGDEALLWVCIFDCVESVAGGWET